MTRLDRFLAYSESRRVTVCVIAALLTASIAWVDWQFFYVSIGFLYLFPVLLAAPALNTWQIVLMATKAHPRVLGQHCTDNWCAIARTIIDD